MTQIESPKTRAKIGLLKIRNSDFVLVSDLGIRISDFGADFLV